MPPYHVETSVATKAGRVSFLPANINEFIFVSDFLNNPIP
tara:strand:+ start:1385 stop:1504 length:120 start_codon:yes stop_codon:yes gene_type:complete